MAGSFFLFSFFVFSGCASVDLNQPVLNSKFYSYPASFEELQSVARATLEAESMLTAYQNEQLGIITTKEFPIQTSEYRQWVKFAPLARSGSGVVTIRVVRQGPHMNQLEITPEFRRTVGRFVERSGRHDTSSGVFEDAMASRIHANLMVAKYPNVLRLVIGCDFRLDGAAGRYVIANVQPASLAAEQGLMEGDLLLGIDGVDVTTTNFYEILSGITETERKTFTIQRSGEVRELPVDIFYMGDEIPWLGFRAEREPETFRFKISEVIPNSPADRAGLRIGDYLLREEGVELHSWHDFYEAAIRPADGNSRSLVVERDGTAFHILVELIPELSVAGVPSPPEINLNTYS